MKSAATLSSKGQITIPAWARRRLDLAPGSRVRLSLDGDRLVLEPLHATLAQLEGALRGVYPEPTAYVDDLREDRCD